MIGSYDTRPIPRQPHSRAGPDYNCLMVRNRTSDGDGPVIATMGDRIEAERVARGWSQQKLADRVVALGGEATQSGIDKLEKRSSKMSSASEYIARALEVNHDWLVTGKGQKRPLRSIDRQLQLLPQDDFDDLYEDFSAIIERRMEKRNIRS